MLTYMPVQASGGCVDAGPVRRTARPRYRQL